MYASKSNKLCFYFRALSHLRRGPEPGDRDTDPQGGVYSLRRDFVSILLSQRGRDTEGKRAIEREIDEKRSKV